MVVVGKMARPLKLVFWPSLKQMALSRLAATLWTDLDLLASIMELQCHENSKRKWERIINIIKGKIEKLVIPKSLSEQMFDLVLNIGTEIRRWEHFLVKTFNLSCSEIFEQVSAKLCFTSAGTVDDRRMAQKIVLCSTIDVVPRYKIACSYWLEDCIPLLWQELTEKDKNHFSKKRFSKGLEFAWPYTFQDGLNCTWRKSIRCPISFNQWAFELSARRGFKATAAYFFQKLSYKERESSLMTAARQAGRKVDTSKIYSHVLHYLLSVMTPKQQFEMVKELPVSVMSCFLDWPQQDLFLENACLICPHLTVDKCMSLLKLAMYRVVIWNNYFPKILSEFFKQSPPHFKDYFVNRDMGAYDFLCRFFRSGDAESIKAIFRSLDSADKVKLIFRIKVLKLFYNGMSWGKWDLVELCLQEAMLPEKESERLYTIFCLYLNTEFFSRQNRFDQIFGGLKSFKTGPETQPPQIFSNDFNQPYMRPKKKKGQKRKFEVM